MKFKRFKGAGLWKDFIESTSKLMAMFSNTTFTYPTGYIGGSAFTRINKGAFEIDLTGVAVFSSVRFEVSGGEVTDESMVYSNGKLYVSATVI